MQEKTFQNQAEYIVFWYGGADQVISTLDIPIVVCYFIFHLFSFSRCSFDLRLVVFLVLLLL